MPIMDSQGLSQMIEKIRQSDCLRKEEIQLLDGLSKCLESRQIIHRLDNQWTEEVQGRAENHRKTFSNCSSR